MSSTISKKVSNLLRVGNVSDAIKLASQRIADGDESAEIYAALAHAHLFNNEPDAAYEVASKGIDVAPNEPAIRFLRARVSYMSRRYFDVLEDYKFFLSQDTSKVVQYYASSICLLAAASYVALGNTAEAKAALAMVAADCVVHAGKLITRKDVEISLALRMSPNTIRQRHYEP
jgi:lipopolysaccharide biosynthesis regulator YciM